LLLLEFDSRIFQPLAQLLCRLRYPGSTDNSQKKITLNIAHFKMYYELALKRVEGGGGQTV